MAGGRRYQGTFQGNYSDKMNFSGEMTSVEDIPTFSVISRNSVKELSDKRGPEESTKWASVFQAFHTTAGLSLGNRGAWDQLAIALHQAKVDAKEQGRSIELGNGLETIPKFGQEPGSLSSSELSEIELYLAQACASPLHPLHWLVSNLVEAYNVSYGGVRSHPTLLPHAMEELESITTRLYKVIKVLFPGLPSATAPTRLQIGLSEEVFFKCLYNLNLCGTGANCHTFLHSSPSPPSISPSHSLHNVCSGYIQCLLLHHMYIPICS